MKTANILRLYYNIILHTIMIVITGSVILWAIFWFRLLINHITN
jgi:hypothetical protein